MDSKRFLKWFRWTIWIGIGINLTFVIPALVAPEFLNSTLGLPLQPSYPWLNNAGMLLLGVSLLYTPAGINPVRWAPLAWLCVVSRLIAVFFWIWLIRTSDTPSAFTGMLITDSTLFVLLGVLLQLGLPKEDKISLRNAFTLMEIFFNWLARCFQPKSARIALVIAIIAVSTIGFQLWVNLIRVVPQPYIESESEHFKYGAIGLGVDARIPLYLFEVLPQFGENPTQDAKAAYQSYGFIFEDGKDLPIGLAKRQIGYPSVEPTCSLCHTGQYQDSAQDTAHIILAGPANTLDLESFQWFLYNTASREDFTSAKVHKAIKEKHDLGFAESLIYRYLILPMAKSSLTKQKKQYAWQKLRPTQGPGRTDTFNPTKMNVFHFPDDSTIGTVDLPQIWNQKPREGMYLHWDGNNNAIRERNYAAAMAVGATLKSVLPESFKRITDWLLQKPPATYPFEIDSAISFKGKAHWDAKCSACHDFGKVNTGQVTTNIEVLGTDRYRLDSFTIGLVDKFHTFKKKPFDFESYRKTQSYSNTPTDGIWARSPYLHNGSVPTMWDLLQAVEKRPKEFYIGTTIYDQKKMGFISSGHDAEKYGKLLDTSLPGNSNIGHLYGTDLSDREKWELIEYMKNL